MVRPGSKEVGKFGEESIYLREDLSQIHTVEKWLQEIKSIKKNEKPAKIMNEKGRFYQNF